MQKFYINVVFKTFRYYDDILDKNFCLLTLHSVIIIFNNIYLNNIALSKSSNVQNFCCIVKMTHSTLIIQIFVQITSLVSINKERIKEANNVCHSECKTIEKYA